MRAVRARELLLTKTRKRVILYSHSVRLDEYSRSDIFIFTNVMWRCR